MYIKQLKIIKDNVVKTLFLTSSDDKSNGGTAILHNIDATEARGLVCSNPTKLPPYNHSNPNTMDITVKTAVVKELMKSVIGVPDKRMMQNIEQNCGSLKYKYFASELPCIAGVYAFKNIPTNDIMISGKLICPSSGSKYMYSMLRKLGLMQEQATNELYIGVIKNRAITKATECGPQYEMLCDFVVSLDALKILEEKKFGFFIDTAAMQDFKYKTAGMLTTKPTDAELTEVYTWCDEHNKMTTQTLLKFKHYKETGKRE